MQGTNGELSVVVTVVSGGDSTHRTLDRLLHQTPRDWLEVLVPLEAYHPDRARLCAAFSDASFPIVDLPEEGVSDHERFDRRRTVGIRQSRGAIVAIIEDHGTPAPDWPERVRDAHTRLPHAVVGGAVANGIDAGFNVAVWLCDFGRYAPPQQAGKRATLTDVNVSYKRDALFAARDGWDPTYHEPVLHEALKARGATLWLDPTIMIAEERPTLSFGQAVRERFEWGKLFGNLRARELRAPKRLLYAAGSMVLTPVLLWRIWRLSPERVARLRLLKATPWIIALLKAWCLGEAIGTLTGSYNPLPTEKKE